MPSGSRKRKAAKKKQEKVAPTPSSTSSTQGGDGEDGVEKFTDDVKKGDVQKEKVAGQDDGGVQVEGEPKPGNGFNQKGDSSSSGCSSDSDDGSQEAVKEVKIVENAPVIDMVEAVGSLSELPVEVTHTTLVTKLDDPVAGCVSEAVEDNISVLDEKVLMESGASADSSISHDVVELGQTGNGKANSSSPEETARLPEVATELAPGDQKDEEIASIPEVAKELAPEDKKKEIIDVAGSSEAAVHKNEENLMLSYNPPVVDTTEDVEDVKESEVLGSADCQTAVTSAVRPDQATSWKSCCGLFEAFSGASR